MSYVEMLDDFINERSEREPSYPWRDLYPQLDPSEWEVRDYKGATFGKKIRGKQTGMLCFYIPAGWRPTKKRKE